MMNIHELAMMVNLGAPEKPRNPLTLYNFANTRNRTQGGMRTHDLMSRIP